MKTDYVKGVAEGCQRETGVISARFNCKETNQRAQGENKRGWGKYESLFNNGIKISDDELILIFHIVSDCIFGIS